MIAPRVQSSIKKLLIFYAVAAIALTAIIKSGAFKTGPCTPNLDIIALLLVFVIAIGLLVFSIVKTIIKRQNAWLIMINFIALFVMFILSNLKQ